MAKNILKTLFAGEDDEFDGETPLDDDALDAHDEVEPAATGRPRSLADAWERLADQDRRIERRLVELEQTQAELLVAVQALSETATKQLEVLKYVGKFHEAAEKRGRAMEHAFQGVPDVLRTLPSATRESAQQLSDIAARLYEKAQDNTVSALKSAQANHQRVIEELIDRSLGQSRKLVGWSILLLVACAVTLLFAWSKLPA